ncbi:MAG TPA: ORF6N domain-containing protein [Thermodesulfobacteriota bacterium]|nr:ORF6N domain-containing protein [Thermodesulfobacteriota bacterium]
MTVPIEHVETRILYIRGHRVMVDMDLAEVYGIPTNALNQAIKRNADRFPEDFAIRLRPEEKMELVAICDQFSRLRHSTAFPGCLSVMLRSIRHWRMIDYAVR